MDREKKTESAATLHIWDRLYTPTTKSTRIFYYDSPR